MEDTWTSRELPVLGTIVSIMNDDMFAHPTVVDIAERSGLEVIDVGRSVRAMNDVYLELQMLMSGGDPSPWFVKKVYPKARIAVGQWPSGDTLVDRLVSGLNEAANDEADVERRTRLRKAAAWIGGGLRDVATEVLGSAIAKNTGMG